MCQCVLSLYSKPSFTSTTFLVSTIPKEGTATLSFVLSWRTASRDKKISLAKIGYRTKEPDVRFEMRTLAFSRKLGSQVSFCSGLEQRHKKVATKFKNLEYCSSVIPNLILASVIRRNRREKRLFANGHTKTRLNRILFRMQHFIYF